MLKVMVEAPLLKVGKNLLSRIEAGNYHLKITREQPNKHLLKQGTFYTAQPAQGIQAEPKTHEIDTEEEYKWMIG